MNEESAPPFASPAALPPTPLAQRYQNARVTVYYHNGVSDTGWVSYFETCWIELTKDNNERLLIPMSAIRLLKLLEPPKKNNDAETLLRAAAPQAETPKIEAKW